MTSHRLLIRPTCLTSRSLPSRKTLAEQTQIRYPCLSDSWIPQARLTIQRQHAPRPGHQENPNAVRTRRRTGNFHASTASRSYTGSRDWFEDSLTTTWPQSCRSHSPGTQVSVGCGRRSVTSSTSTKDQRDPCRTTNGAVPLTKSTIAASAGNRRPMAT